jgi:soluble lytic murein transglycosylase
MRQSLTRLLDRYPRGDMRGDARFALAFDARTRGEHAAALEHFDKLLADGPGEHAEGYEGRAAYWRARTLHSLNRTQEAAAAYAAIARDKPLGYHAQQAIARLRELDPAAADALLAELSPPSPAPQPLLFGWRVELETPSFRSAIELLRVGEGDIARQDLHWIGAMGEGSDTDMLWLVAAVLHEAQAYAEASQLVRSRLRTFRNTPPIGRARQLWRIAYPRAFEPLIEQAAAEQQIPSEFVRAVAREESSFNPEAVSPALAYGLIQLIRPTARTHARSMGLPSDPASLKRPEINLRIGSHFIKELYRRYPSNPAVVPAAYNAGEAATDRWLRESPGVPLDEWIERIPYRETKRYTRRVLQTYGIYAFLDTGKLPPLPAALPAAPAP